VAFFTKIMEMDDSIVFGTSLMAARPFAPPGGAAVAFFHRAPASATPFSRSL
jgi:hypothetical protein